MTLKNPYKFIVRIFLDLLMLSAIGNALSIFMIPGDWWSFSTNKLLVLHRDWLSCMERNVIYCCSPGEKAPMASIPHKKADLPGIIYDPFFGTDHFSGFFGLDKAFGRPGPGINICFGVAQPEGGLHFCLPLPPSGECDTFL